MVPVVVEVDIVVGTVYLFSATCFKTNNDERETNRQSLLSSR
jgi:hypothetical protein